MECARKLEEDPIFNEEENAKSKLFIEKKRK